MFHGWGGKPYHLNEANNFFTHEKSIFKKVLYLSLIIWLTLQSHAQDFIDVYVKCYSCMIIIAHSFEYNNVQTFEKRCHLYQCFNHNLFLKLLLDQIVNVRHSPACAIQSNQVVGKFLIIHISHIFEIIFDHFRLWTITNSRFVCVTEVWDHKGVVGRRKKLWKTKADIFNFTSLPSTDGLEERAVIISSAALASHCR